MKFVMKGNIMENDTNIVENDTELLLSSMGELREQYQRLRNQSRLVWTMLGLGVCVFVLTAAENRDGSGIFRNSLEILNENNEVRADIVTRRDGGGFYVFTPDKEKSSAYLKHSDKSGPSLVLKDKRGRVRIRLGFNERGDASFTMMDSNGRTVEEFLAR